MLDKLQITPDILKLIAEIDEFKGTWKALNALSPERLKSLKHVATIESIGSSTRIEGAKLSDKQVEALLQDLGQGSFASRDEEEVAGYAEVMDMIFANFDDVRLSENYIKQFHKELLRHSQKDARHRGNYKNTANNVEAFDGAGESLGVVFETASPFETPLRMERLINWTREAMADQIYHPLLVIGAFVAEFLAIHPFQDGNGRLSRVLTSLLLLKANYAYTPYASLEAIVERNKQGYYLSLRRTQSTLGSDNPDWLPWLRFFLTCLKAQKDHLAVKVAQETDIMLGELPDESKLVLDFVAKHGRITTAQAGEVMGIPRPTVKLRLKQLVDTELLEAKGQGRGAYYVKLIARNSHQDG